MNANSKQDSAVIAELPLPTPPQRYLLQRALNVELAAANGIVEEPVPTALARLRFLPRQYDRTTHALRIPCREFDGSYHAEAEQVVLFGNFTDEEGRLQQRQRFSAKGVPNRVAWYGNTTNPTQVVYCESRAKALVVAQAHPGWLCAGLNGVDGWSAGKDKEDNPIPAANLLPPINTADLPAILLPDSHHHKRVRRAMEALRAQLTSHYRSVTTAKLPDPLDEREDWGADDVAAAFGVRALQLYVREAPQAANPYVLQTAPTIAAQQPPPWVVRGLIPADELTLIVGETSCGKTFLTTDLLLAIARGQQQWFGRPLKVTGAVVHISLETRGLPRRLQAYAQHHACPLPADYHVLAGNITLHEDYEKIIRTLQGVQPVAIAVDTVNRALGGGDENSSADMGAFVRAAERLRLAFPGCAVLLVHHLGKNAERGARGHSSLKAAVGAELMITNDGPVRTVTVEKQRDGETGLRLPFTLEKVLLPPDEDGEVSSCVVVQATAPAAVDGNPTDRQVFEAIARYWRETHGAAPVSKEALRNEYARIKAKAKGGMRINKGEFLAAWDSIVREGRWVTPVEGAANGQYYRLVDLLERKF